MSRSDFIRVALMQKMGIKSLINPDVSIDEEVEKRFQQRWEEYINTLPDE